MRALLDKVPKDWPRVVCPGCQKNIERPDVRWRLLISSQSTGCPECGQPLVLRGNHLLFAFCGAILLVLGGRIYSQEFHFLLSAVFFIGGVGTIAYGLNTAKLEVAGRQSPSKNEALRGDSASNDVKSGLSH